MFELQVIEQLGVVLLIEDKLEFIVVDEFLDPADVALEVYIFQLEAELQVLVVEDADVGLRVVAEVFDHSG